MAVLHEGDEASFTFVVAHPASQVGASQDEFAFSARHEIASAVPGESRSPARPGYDHLQARPAELSGATPRNALLAPEGSANILSHD